MDWVICNIRLALKRFMYFRRYTVAALSNKYGQMHPSVIKRSRYYQYTSTGARLNSQGVILREYNWYTVTVRSTNRVTRRQIQFSEQRMVRYVAACDVKLGPPNTLILYQCIGRYLFDFFLYRVCCILYLRWFPGGVWLLGADVSEHSYIFIARVNTITVARRWIWFTAVIFAKSNSPTGSCNDTVVN
jgi:hypothetical protein